MSKSNDNKCLNDNDDAGSGCDVPIIFSLHNEGPGSLAQLLTELAAHNINLRLIDTRRSKRSATHGSQFEFLIIVGAADAERVRAVIGPQCRHIVVHAGSRALAQTAASESVPWFPRTVAEIDVCSRLVFTVGVELNADHPGFLDAVYRARRMSIVDLTSHYRVGSPIRRVEYTAAEVQTWNTCYSSLMELYPKHACDKYNEIRQDMFDKCGYRLDNVPQLEDVSNYLEEHSGFRIRPVGGLLSPRSFLAGFAFKVYHATQYMRHESRPFYTPEPDVCHELLGHLPMFADPQFAEFVHQIGLASLGAPDEYTERLSTCLWFTVEFGLCRERGELRAFGGGLLSSVDELLYALSDKPEVRDFEPVTTCMQTYPITELQPVYYATESIERARDQIIEYAKTVPRPFKVAYDDAAQRIVIQEKDDA